MYEEAYGLRFDIYERVHLSDECVGIDQLEEVELTPHIQVIPAGDQVTVRGSLLLAGVYQGDDEGRGSQTLEHWIPVEITLPLNRIRSLEDISVDIEHFDVDLLSARSLNITGILSLKGIAMEPAEPSNWEPEQFTVVHQAEEERGSDEPEWLRDYGEAAARPPSPEALDAVARIRSLADGDERREEEWQAVPEPEADLVREREKTYSEYLDKIEKSKKAAAAEAEESEPEKDPDRTELTWNHAPWASPSVQDSPPAAPKAVAEAEALAPESDQQGEPEDRGLDEEEAAEQEAKEKLAEASAGHIEEKPAEASAGHTEEKPVEVSVGRTEEKPAEVSAGHTVEKPAEASAGRTGEKPVEVSVGRTEEKPAEVSAGHTEEKPAEASAGHTEEKPVEVSVGRTEEKPAEVSAGRTGEKPAEASAGRTEEKPAKWKMPQPQSWAASAPAPEREPAPAPEPAIEVQAEPRAEEKPAEVPASVASTTVATTTEATVAEASVAESGGADAGLEAEPAEDAAAAAAGAADAKPEMKIAINSSKPADAPAASGVGLSSLLQSSRQTKEREQREAETKQAEEEAALEAAKVTTGDDVKWQSLFLQRVNEEQGFKKVRLCIVQREETLDTIADRYQMNTNEIVLYNRLSDQNITEGQVLYIPVTS
ncbi:LysM peptidoglycan-binding domain-containing protein [Paenibacillus thiaminolyticus]|uniref:LysM peptidoglycan-binding domain-containing protein n=2 Tax=Paenibacillus thiaminolyticus TaxID=49283 RepID=A0AAP9J3R1_PANTH|nr:LysM peptidoglycan-binding domain-containing protein [Paenibacillus thiaminolyticus]QDM46220.1 LysM peptidoglycan-binding domain-containing protein [Paenibacillus thiaminolyticus]CAH8708266.1 LysM peptidoglycan-binding domain-containing protein [Paenibacillus thiaminolyticus]